MKLLKLLHLWHSSDVPESCLAVHILHLRLRSWPNWISRFIAPRTLGCSFSAAMAGRWFLGSTPLKVLRSAVKTNLLINPIDRFENRGKCDLHTAGMINALTDFFFFFFPPNLISSVLKEVKEREGDLMPIDPLLCRRECKAFYYALKGRAF